MGWRAGQWGWLPLTLALTGCDVQFSVLGAVADQSGVPKSCRLFIREVEGGLGCCSKMVDPKNIDQRFWVLPGQHPYDLVLECPGFQDYAVRAVYGRDMTSSEPLDLGSIILLPK